MWLCSMHSVLDHADPATVGPLEHSVLDMEMRNDNLDSSNEPQFGSDLGQFGLELEDAIRREVLKSRSMVRVSACDVNGLLLSQENACLGDMEMSLDEVRLEGLRQWNMDMDVEYQYETFDGLPVYYGGDMYDSEDSEEYDPLEMARSAYVEDYNFDVPEGMELMTYTRSRPDGGEARIVNTVDNDNDNDFISNIYNHIFTNQLFTIPLLCNIGDQYCINTVFLLTPDDHQVCGRVCDGIDCGRDPSQEGGIIYYIC